MYCTYKQDTVGSNPEAVHFSLEKDRWADSGVVVLYLISSNIHVYLSAQTLEFVYVCHYHPKPTQSQAHTVVHIHMLCL